MWWAGPLTTFSSGCPVIIYTIVSVAARMVNTDTYVRIVDQDRPEVDEHEQSEEQTAV